MLSLCTARVSSGFQQRKSLKKGEARTGIVIIRVTALPYPAPSCLSLTCPGERSCLSCAVWEHIPISLQPNSFPTWPALHGPHPALQTLPKVNEVLLLFLGKSSPSCKTPVTESATRRKSRLGSALSSQIQRKLGFGHLGSLCELEER